MPRKRLLILILRTAVSATGLLLPQMRKSQAAVIPVTKYGRHMHQFRGLLVEERMSNNANVNIMLNAWIRSAKRDAALRVACE